MAATATQLDQLARGDARADRMFRWSVAAAGLFVLAGLMGAALTMAWGGREAFATYGWSFLTSDNWDPGNLIFGGLAPIVGTLITAGIALLLAVPVSFGIALFLTEVAPVWLRGPVGTAIELLAGIPSIIYGMWGLFVLVPFLATYVYPFLSDTVSAWPIISPWFDGPPIGIGMLTAGIVLSIMVIPFIASVMREVFLTVPNRLKESAYALGSTTFEVVWNIVLPYTRSAVIGGVFLGLGRALKADPMTDAIPVVLLTARAAAEDQIAGLAAGADAYLVKPFDPGVLTACVENLLTQRRRLRERFRQGEVAPPESAPAAPSPLDLRLRPLVQARLLDPEFSAEALAAAAGLSYHQLYRALRDELNSTPSRYIRTVRAECAAELLRQGAGSVTEVAYAVGFESLSYFRRAFRERFDQTPSDFLTAEPGASPRL